MTSEATAAADHIRTLAGPTIHCMGIDSPFVAEARSAAATSNFERFEIDLHDVRTKAALLDCIARVMDFPDYFGRNWDALSDCLRDLNWVSSEAYFVVIDGFDELNAHCAQDASILLDVLSHAVSYWRSYNWHSADARPMFVVILSGACASIAEGANFAFCNHGAG